MARITILMTVFNGEQFLDETIASVIEQDYDDYELLIVDDGSVDGTSAILERWSSRDARIRVLRNETNLGIARSANLGLSAACAAYVARLDADDLCLPGRFKAQIEALDRDPGAVLVATNYEVIDAKGRTLSVEKRAAPPEVIEYLLHFSNALGGHSQILFRRDAVCSIGGYSEELGVCVDYDLWSRLVRLGRFVVLPILGMKYRLHNARVSVRRRDEQRRNSMRISEQMLTSLLGNELSADELEAVRSVWREEGRRGVASRAHRFLSKAFGRFCSGNANRSHRALVRKATARRWVFASVRFVRTRDYRDTLLSMAYAMRWHPLGAIEAVMIVWRRFRTARRLQRGVRESYEAPDESNSLIPLA